MKIDCSYIIFYGSLMEGFETKKRLAVEHQLEFVNEVTFQGKLYDLGDYPGLKLHGTSLVKGQIYKILAPACLSILDEYEGFDPDDLDASLYLRKKIFLNNFNLEAWVYEFRQEVSQQPYIPSGDWAEYFFRKK